jgi:hypothetical protein
MFSVGFFYLFYQNIPCQFSTALNRAFKPLEVTGMGPFKAKYALAQNDWRMANIFGGGGTFGLNSLIEYQG